jgi:NitT/TauT family transport system substrate-binding protein/putative hydroxymethylpyrimidine transport system substrate-binding protein
MRRLAAALVIAIAIAGCGGDGGGDGGPDTVTLALDFQPNAVHAGIYTAAETGLDERAGVRLRVRVPAASTDSLKLLAAGRADISVVDIHDLGLARERGEDLVGIGAIVQRPLAAVIARAELLRPRQLEGERVGVTGLPSDDAVVRAVVEGDRGRLDRVRTTTIGFSAVPSLTAGRVDAVTAFWNAEGVSLRFRGVRTSEFRVDDFGAPRYPELVLVTKRETLRERRDDIRRAVAAIAAGTRAALRDRAAATRRMVRVSDGRADVVDAQLAALTRAFDPPLRLDRAVLEEWADWDVRFGILKHPPDIDRAFDFSVAGR